MTATAQMRTMTITMKIAMMKLMLSMQTLWVKSRIQSQVADMCDEGTADEQDVPSHVLVSLIVMMMYLVCSCFTVLHKVGSGNYDHSATTTRAMRLRLPDIAGHIEILEQGPIVFLTGQTYYIVQYTATEHVSCSFRQC